MTLNKKNSVIFIFTLFLTACAGIQENTKKDSPVTPVDTKYIWDLSDLYPDLSAWDAARVDAAKKISQLAKLQGTLSQSSESFLHASDQISAVYKEVVRIYIHASLRADTDTRNAENEERSQLAANLFNIHWKIKSNFYLSNDIRVNLSKLSLLGSHQLINAGLAIHLARNILKEKFVIEKTEKALMNCEWPGRLQQIKSGNLNKKIKKYKNIYLDGFHNIDGMKALIKSLPKNRKILICSFLNNKKYTQMLSNLSNHFNKIIVVKMNEENSITEDLLPKYLKLYFANSLSDSFKIINKLSSNQTSIYFGGSLYFIGEVIKLNRLKN